MPCFKPANMKKIKINKKKLTTLDNKHKEFLNEFSKDENDKIIGCNKTLGCKGAKCLCGYIKVNTPLEDYSKSKTPQDFHTMMQILLNNLPNAFENADWLREEISNDANLNTKPCYEQVLPLVELFYLLI